LGHGSKRQQTLLSDAAAKMPLGLRRKRLIAHGIDIHPWGNRLQSWNLRAAKRKKASVTQGQGIPELTSASVADMSCATKFRTSQS
jgi:hypothetical protein